MRPSSIFLLKKDIDATPIFMGVACYDNTIKKGVACYDNTILEVDSCFFRHYEGNREGGVMPPSSAFFLKEEIVAKRQNRRGIGGTMPL